MFFLNLLRLGSLSLAIVCSNACRDESINAIRVSPTPPAVPVVNSKGDRAMNEIIQKILAKDPTATLDAKRVGRSDSEPVARLTNNEDPVVRELALRCLIESGGDGLS